MVVVVASTSTEEMDEPDTESREGHRGSEAARKYRALALAPAAILTVLAIAHLAAVSTIGASRWRVGGMGMYSENHPNDREIVLEVDGVTWRGRQKSTNCTNGSELRRQATTHPTRSNLRAFARSCFPEALDGATVRVVHPRLDPKTLEVSTRVVREVEW